MRRIKLVVAALAFVVASFVSFSGPAVASDWDDWNGCWGCSNWDNNCWCGNNFNNDWDDWNGGGWWWHPNFDNCLFLPAVTIC